MYFCCFVSLCGWSCSERRTSKRKVAGSNKKEKVLFIKFLSLICFCQLTRGKPGYLFMYLKYSKFINVDHASTSSIVFL